MNKIIKGYYYLFYKLYRFYESSIFIWWSDWKTVLSIDILIIMLVITAEGIISIFLKRSLLPNDTPLPIIIIGLIISIINHFVFLYNDKWKPYVEEFNKFSKRKNVIGGIIVWSFIAFVFASLFFIFYLLSQTNWVFE